MAIPGWSTWSDAKNAPPRAPTTGGKAKRRKEALVISVRGTFATPRSGPPGWSRSNVARRRPPAVEPTGVTKNSMAQRPSCRGRTSWPIGRSGSRGQGSPSGSRLARSATSARAIGASVQASVGVGWAVLTSASHLAAIPVASLSLVPYKPVSGQLSRQRRPDGKMVGQERDHCVGVQGCQHHQHEQPCGQSPWPG